MAVSTNPRPAARIEESPQAATMLAELENLKSTDQGYDEEFLKPTDAVFKRARTLLCESTASVSGPYPAGDIYPDGSGGIRADWKSSDRHISFVLFSDPKRRGYIYVQQGDRFGGDYDVTGDRLGQYLFWLTNGDVLPFGLQLHSLSRA